MREKVDGAGTSSLAQVPAHLDVRHLHGVADRLHVLGGVLALRPENAGHASRHQLTNCKIMQSHDILFRLQELFSDFITATNNKKKKQEKR